MCLVTCRLFLVRWAWEVWSNLLLPVFLVVLTIPTSAGTEKTRWSVPTFSLIIGDPWSQTGITASSQNSHAYRHHVPSWRSFMIVRGYHPKRSLYCDSTMKKQDLAFSLWVSPMLSFPNSAQAAFLKSDVSIHGCFPLLWVPSLFLSLLMLGGLQERQNWVFLFALEV